MAYERNITAEDQVFYDTDRLLRYAVYQGNPTAAQILANTALPQDVTSWDLSWVLRKKVNSVDPPLIEKMVGAGIVISGTFNASASLNTQRVEVTLEDTDTYDPAGSPTVQIKAGSYFYALKRTDDGEETILAYGTFALLQVAAWE